jgi:hypothetical protein
MDDIYLVSSELQGLMVEFRKTKGQWQLGTSKGMPLQMPCLKPRRKRSAVLSLAHVGLGMLDETEVETIPGRKSGTNGSSFNRSRPVT